jgi:protein-L-isoaspartate(D-aspartate) O-methyltransferase
MIDRSSRLWRRRLVAYLRRQRLIVSPEVEQAFLDVPRERFVPQTLAEGGLAAVYRDDAIVTRRDPATRLALSSSSQPAIMAIMLAMLDVRPGERVLEVGAGTGYNAALLDRLVRPGGWVASVDIDIETVLSAAEALRGVGAGVSLAVADGVVGLPGLARFGWEVDRMMVTASTALVPRSWHEQLVDGGRLVVPLRLSDEIEQAHAVTAFVRVPWGFDSVKVTAGGFMPLRREDGSTFGPGRLASSPEPRADLGGDPSPFGEIGRAEMDRLTVVVRYGDQPPRTRWQLDRGNHWIGVDVPHT